MIEYYYKFFLKSYSSKIRDLISDLDKLFNAHDIKLVNNPKIVLNPKYKASLKEKDWIVINQYYNTLYQEKELPEILEKYINKTQNNENKKYKFIDTFAGCGGLSVGMENAGFNCVLVNEIEPKFLETYYFNRDLKLDNYYCGDIKDLVEQCKDLNQQNDIDLVVGGPPCQGFSMANRQRVIDDPRNKLYKYFLQMLSIIRPKFFVMENVKGMINKSDEIIENFHDMLGDDYSIKMILLNAKEFGIPQNRERVIVIGCNKQNKVNPEKIIEDILLEQKRCHSFVLKDAINNLPELKPKRVKNDSKVENLNIGYKFRKCKINSSLYTQYINNGKECEYIFNHINRYNNERDIEIFDKLPQGENSLHESIKNIMPYVNRNHMFKDKYFKLNENLVSKTITAHMKFDCNMYIHPTQARGLSPREAARIQTFPDNYVFMGSNNIWYAQIGNAVPVKLAEIIGKQIIKYLQ